MPHTIHISESSRKRNAERAALAAERHAAQVALDQAAAEAEQQRLAEEQAARIAAEQAACRARRDYYRATTFVVEA